MAEGRKTREMARIAQLVLPGCERHGLLELRQFVRRNQRRQWKRYKLTPQERRLAAARRDPRQVSIYGSGHEEELNKL